MNELWKDIKGYEGLYQVSNLGRVKSLDRDLYQKDAYGGKALFKYKGKILKNVIHGSGYVVVPLGRNKCCVRVHQLVAKAFIPNPDNKPIVNHIDGNKVNNRVDNLEWCTFSENTRHAFDVLKCPFGAYQNRPIRCVETGEVFKNSQIPAKGNKVTANNIRMCASPKYPRKTCLGYHWEFI